MSTEVSNDDARHARIREHVERVFLVWRIRADVARQAGRNGRATTWAAIALGLVTLVALEMGTASSIGFSVSFVLGLVLLIGVVFAAIAVGCAYCQSPEDELAKLLIHGLLDATPGEIVARGYQTDLLPETLAPDTAAIDQAIRGTIGKASRSDEANVRAVVEYIVRRYCKPAPAPKPVHVPVLQQYFATQ